MAVILNLILLVFFPLTFLGIINKTKSFCAAKIGPSIWQVWFDFFKYWKKGQVISTTTTFIYTWAPIVSVSAIIIAGLLIPMVAQQAIYNFPASFIVFSYILALSRLSTILMALDTGSSFEGMGANRENTYAILSEPAFLMVFASLVLLGNPSLTFSGMISGLQISEPIYLLIRILVISIFFIMMLIEGCRVPIDDPKTHLELTMIHEVMVLDNSGPDMAMITYGAGLKMQLFAVLIINLLLPSSLSIGMSFLYMIISLSIIAILIGILESLMARFRLSHIPQFVFLLISTALIVVSLVVLFTSGGLA